MRRMLAFWLGLLLAGGLWAGPYDVGTTAGQFWKLGLDPRGEAMGGAMVAVAEGPLGMLENPASLRRKGGGLQLMELEWFGDVRAGAFGLEQAVEELGAVGFTLGYLVLPQQEVTEQVGTGPDPRLNYQVVGTFQPANLQAGLSWARDFAGGLRGGLGVKYQRQELGGESAQEIAGDLGLLYKAGDFRFGLVGQNLGAAASLRAASFALPALLRVGAGYQAKALPLLLAAEAALPADNQGAAAFGLEYRVAEALALRGGYRFDGIFNPWTLGLGLRLGSFGVDVATSPAGELGQTYRAGLRWDWGPGYGSAKDVKVELAALGLDAAGWTLGLTVSEGRAVASWALYVRSAAKGSTVWQTGGQGEPPKELRWAGADAAGRPAEPGTYHAIAALKLKDGKVLYTKWIALPLPRR